MTAGTGPPGRVHVLGDEGEYWRGYVRSLGPGPPSAVPVLAARPELTREVLAEAGLAVAGISDAWPGDGAGTDGLGQRVAGLAAGLAALARDCDLARVPMLERGLRARRPAECRSGAWVVGVGAGAALGLARAVADGRAFLAVEDLDDERLTALGARARSVHVVAERLPLGNLAMLGRRLAALATHELLPGVPGCPVGYLTGRDAAAMTVLDAKQRLAGCSRPGRPAPGAPGSGVPVPGASRAPAGMDVVVDSTLSSGPGTPAGSTGVAADLALVPYREVSGDTIRRHDAIRLLAITSHGMSDLIHLNDDYICGRSRYLELGSPPADRLPSCTMADGAYCFFKRDGTPVPAHALPAEHVFVNSCGSLRFGETDFDPLFAVWFSALDGRPRSFVGSTRWKDGHGLEGHLYRCLLRAGFPLGAAVALLNRALPAHQLESGGDVYALLGDPEDRLVEPHPAGPVPELGPGRNRARLDGGWARLTLGSPELARAAADQMLAVDAPAEAKLVATTLPARPGAAAQVLLHGPGHTTGGVEVRVRDLTEEHRRAQDAARAIQESLDPVLGMQGLYPDKIRQGGRKNLEGRLVHIARLWKARFTEPTVVPRLLKSLRSLDAELDQADAEIARWLHERIRTTSYRFSEHYQETFLLCDGPPVGRCYICGDELTHRLLRHVLRPEVSRSELICGRCGGIEDRPEDSLALEVHLAEIHRRGTRADVVVRLRNTSATAREGYCVAAVRRSGELGIEQTEPVRRVRVGPAEVAELPFPLLLGDAVPVHQYDLQAAFVSMTRIHLGRRSFWVSAG